MPAFSSLNEQIQACLRERGFEPTPIQEAAIPRIASGASVLVIAPTGTGKTEAALLPLFQKLMEAKPKGLALLYITPLRALNRNMLERVEWWAQKLGLTIGVRHGDTPQKERTHQQKHPPNILITTPETLQSILPAPKMGENLVTVKYVVIDEVHELVSDKRGAQLAVALERLALRAGDFQRIGLSATIGEPEKVAAFFKLGEVVRDESSERNLQLTVECPRYSGEDVALAESLHTLPDVVARLRRLKGLVDKHNSVLTFVNTRQMAELLASRFEAWDKSQHIGVHHSSLSREVRVVAEKKFKDGTFKGLIATSSLELGIDIGAIELVAQYMSPRQVARLLQRVGRSGHAISRFPKGVILTTDAEDALEAGAIARAALEGRMERTTTFEKPLDVLAHQIVGISLDLGRVKADKAYDVVKRAYPFRDLEFTEFLEVLGQLVSEQILWMENEQFGKKKAAFIYYYTNLSMIPDEVKFFVRDALDNRNIATLDESFVVNNLGIGEFFISRGTPWKVLDISEREVLVEPAEDISGAIPAWEGEQIPVPYYIAQEVGRLRKEVVNEKFNFPEYCMDGAAFVEAHSLMKKQAEHYVPDEKTVAVETADNFLIMHCHFGSLVNETLAKVLSVLVSAYTGASITTKSDPYRIVFQFPSEPRPDLVKKFLFETRPESLGSILERSLLRTTLFRYRFIHVAKRFGLIEKQHDYQKISIRKLIEAVLDSPIYRETLSEIFTEKLDVETAKEVLRDIQDSKIRFVEHPGQPTPLTLYSLKRLMSFPDLVLPGRPEAEIIRIMKARINNKRAKLFCTFCKSIFYERIDRLPQKINCPHCQSNMVSYAKADENIAEIWGKARSDAEKKKRKEYEQIAVLVSTYGKRAIIVLSGHGIGPDAATRILGRLRKSDEELYRDMLDAQRDFLRTHRYWS